jgi:hypothetical protein
MPAISPNKPYRVGRSKTGLGLFATRPIKKGTKIIRYFGPILDSRKKDEDAIENKYLFELNGRWTIDGSIRQNLARYINHACKPNAESDVKPRKRKVFIRAIKDIEPGEEINYDYGTDYFKAYLKPIGCKCEACERKRKKKRAEARAERLRLKEKAERKAKKKAEKLAKAKDKAKDEAKQKVKALNGKALNGKALNGKASNGKALNGKALNGKTLNNRALNGNANGKHSNGKSLNGKSLNGKSLNGKHRSSQAVGRSSAGAPAETTPAAANERAAETVHA